MKQLKASTEFKINKHSITWVGGNFSEHFLKMTFKPEKPSVVSKTLKKPMLDKEILSELKPEEVGLGFLLYCLDNSDSMLKNGYSNIFYIRDQSNTLWSVHADRGAGGGGWYVEAYSVGDPLGWAVGLRVLSRGFSDTVPVDPLKLRALEERVERLERLFNKELLTQEKQI